MAKDLSSTKERKKLGKKEFALPGKRKYPIPDKAHARNALARVAQNGQLAWRLRPLTIAPGQSRALGELRLEPAP